MDDTVRTEAKMTICFIKDVSLLLALVSAVRENNFERHLYAECEIVKYCFVFDHINFTCYVSHQQVYLRELQYISSNAIIDLTQRDFGGSLSGDSFSCLYGDLITEWTNQKAGIPHSAGFSTEIAKVNIFVATSHIHVKVRQTLSDKIQLNTRVNYKECTPRARRLHNNNAELFKKN